MHWGKKYNGWFFPSSLLFFTGYLLENLLYFSFHLYSICEEALCRQTIINNNIRDERTKTLRPKSLVGQVIMSRFSHPNFRVQVEREVSRQESITFLRYRKLLLRLAELLKGIAFGKSQEGWDRKIDANKIQRWMEYTDVFLKNSIV